MVVVNHPEWLGKANEEAAHDLGGQGEEKWRAYQRVNDTDESAGLRGSH